MGYGVKSETVSGQSSVVCCSGFEQQDRSVAAAIQFQIGDKCLVPVPGELSRYYNGEVASDIRPNGCHMVSHMTLT